MNLPEGFLLDLVASRFRKSMDVNDDMNLLALTSTRTSGRVWARYEDAEEAGPPRPMRLKEILASPGTERLFDELVERYALHTAIAGVQPKVVVPEARATGRRTAVGEKSQVHAPDLIVKAGREFPGIAENEFLCMSMAREAGIDVPDFWLSERADLFVIRRFDVGPGGYLGFEDMASLTGRHPRDKYDASYADVARALSDFCAPAHRAESLERFFRRLAFCCLIRNGDAHLKNWGILYSDPQAADDDARLSPAYDLVCTPVWIPEDTLALGLGGTKAWPTRAALERFGVERCGLGSPRRVLDEVVERTMAYRPGSRTRMWKEIRAHVERAALH
jgi:serine/threonine-protein kinase HipA